MPEVPPPQLTPGPPSIDDEDTGEHPAIAGKRPKKKRPSMTQVILLSALAAVTSTGGTIVFLLGYAQNVEAKSVASSVAAAQAIAIVQAQRGDVLAAEQNAQKQRLEVVDAGVRGEVQAVKVEVSQLRSSIDKLRDDNASMKREILNELRKR